MLIRARAPLRLGLAGGGTDVSPYCDNFGGYILNATIDRYAYATIKLLDDKKISFIASDKQIHEHEKLAMPINISGELILHKAVYSHMIKNFNNNIPVSLELITYCDAPPGSGLGSSSTLVVSMIRAFVELFNLPLDDYTIANIAYQIERVECGLQGGRQDQFSATFGGFNFMEFSSNNRAVINPLRIKNWILCELESSLILFFTGISRESAKIISDQSSNVNRDGSAALEAMHGIKNEALIMKECLLKGDFNGFVKSMKDGWENKKNSSNSVSNQHLNNIYDSAINAGALAGKVSGAGGGGFMLFFVPAENRMDVVKSLEKYNGQISNCHFTKNGTQAWRI